MYVGFYFQYRFSSYAYQHWDYKRSNVNLPHLSVAQYDNDNVLNAFQTMTKKKWFEWKKSLTKNISVSIWIDVTENWIYVVCEGESRLMPMPGFIPIISMSLDSIWIVTLFSWSCVAMLRWFLALEICLLNCSHPDQNVWRVCAFEWFVVSLWVMLSCYNKALFCHAAKETHKQTVTWPDALSITSGIFFLSW